jgi:hypothetical protein
VKKKNQIGFIKKKPIAQMLFLKKERSQTFLISKLAYSKICSAVPLREAILALSLHLEQKTLLLIVNRCM